MPHILLQPHFSIKLIMLTTKYLTKSQKSQSKLCLFKATYLKSDSSFHNLFVELHNDCLQRINAHSGLFFFQMKTWECFHMRPYNYKIIFETLCTTRDLRHSVFKEVRYTHTKKKNQEMMWSTLRVGEYRQKTRKW